MGHKLLLTNAWFYTSETIIIGITSSSLLSKKKWAHFLEDFETRKQRVENFIKLFTNNKIEARIYELNDPWGPAGEVDEIESLILTQETAKGGDYCNKIRAEKGLSQLELVFVDMILNDNQESGEKAFSNKTSSSYIRQYLDEKTGFKAEELYQRFFDLWDRINFPEELKLKWWTILRDSYSTHWRYYFNLNHIYQILQKFDKYYDEEIYPAEYKTLIEVAIWFHRIVFIPLAIDSKYNVEQSNMILKSFMEETKYEVITKSQFEFLKSLVMSVHRHRKTQTYEDDLHNKLNTFFLDIILSFLGFEEEVYKKFTILVRKDFLWIEKSEFRQKRKIILQRLIDRERIFLSDSIYTAFEEQARKNLKSELSELEE